jgi:uncharacterized Zn finger protein (UPF0148 family)
MIAPIFAPNGQVSCAACQLRESLDQIREVELARHHKKIGLEPTELVEQSVQEFMEKILAFSTNRLQEDPQNHGQSLAQIFGL